jgi:hypothetical protein
MGFTERRSTSLSTLVLFLISWKVYGEVAMTTYFKCDKGLCASGERSPSELSRLYYIAKDYVIEYRHP